MTGRFTTATDCLPEAQNRDILQQLRRRSEGRDRKQDRKGFRPRHHREGDLGVQGANLVDQQHLVTMVVGLRVLHEVEREP